MTTKYFCNRCDREIEYRVKLTFENKTNSPGERFHFYDLCATCERDFFSFMKNETKH